MWGLTTQNEPIDGLIPFFPFNSMGWTSSMQKDWVKNYFGPILHENGYQDVKVMILDDNTILLPYWAKDVIQILCTSKHAQIKWVIHTKNIVKFLRRFCRIQTRRCSYPELGFIGIPDSSRVTKEFEKPWTYFRISLYWPRKHAQVELTKKLHLNILCRVCVCVIGCVVQDF